MVSNVDNKLLMMKKHLAKMSSLFSSRSSYSYKSAVTIARKSLIGAVFTTIMKFNFDSVDTYANANAKAPHVQVHPLCYTLTSLHRVKRIGYNRPSALFSV